MSVSEDWRGELDPVKRRRLQNKYNQRESRARRAKAQANKNTLVIKQWDESGNSYAQRPARKIEAIVVPVNSTGKLLQDAISDADESPDTSSSESNVTALSSEIGDPGTVGGEQKLMPYQLWLLDQTEMSSLERRHFASVLQARSDRSGFPDDHLITLIYYNVFRGFATISAIMGLKMDRLCDDYLPSPFLPCSPTATSAVTRLPRSLQATQIQKTVDHHAYIDLYPFAAVRDNLICAQMTEEQEEEMCTDLMGAGSDPDDFLSFEEGLRTGTTLWGDPTDTRNWEISEYMATKWNFLFKGAYDLQDATNARRIARGWKAIYFA